MRKLAEAQQRASRATPAPLAPRAAATTAAGVAGGAGGGRVLGPGFVAGGSIGADSRQEVMRLTAQLDSMAQKLRTKDEQLHRIESSLVSATKLREKERMESEASLASARSTIQELAANSQQLNKCCAELTSRLNQQTTKPASSGEGFELAAKRAEDFDDELTSLKDRIEALSTEKTALETRAAAADALESRTKGLEEQIATASRAKAAAEEVAKLARESLAARDAEVSELRQRLAEREFLAAEPAAAVDAATMVEKEGEIATLQSAIASLEERSRTATDAAAARLREALADSESAVQRADAVEFDRDVRLREMDDRLKASERQLARARADVETLRAVAAASTAERSFELANEASRTGYRGSACSRQSKARQDGETDDEADDEVDDETGAAAPAMDPEIFRTGPRRSMLAEACGAALPSALAAEFSVLDEEAVEAVQTMEPMDTERRDQQEHMQKILKSVSADITTACKQMRTSYLKNMGLPEEEILEKMRAFDTQ